MSSGLYKIVFASCFFIFHYLLYAQQVQPYVFLGSENGALIGEYISFLQVDGNHAEPLTRASLQTDEFQRSEVPSPNFGFLSGSILASFSISNQSDQNVIKLEIKNTLLDSVELYRKVDTAYLLEGISGSAVTFDAFHPNNILPSFALHIERDSIEHYLLRVKSKEQVLLPIAVSTLENSQIRNQGNRILFGIFVGIMLVMFLYNTVVYIIVKDKSYLFYVLYILFIGLAQSSIAGYTKIFFWPNAPQFHGFSIVLFSALAGFGAIAFAQNFLQLKTHAPRVNKGLNIFYFTYAASVLFYVLGVYTFSFNLLNIGGLLVSIYAIGFSAYLSLKGLRAAKFYFVAWLFFLSGIIIFVLRNFGILPYNFMTENAIQMGSAIEAVLLSVALADRINVLKKDKEKSQADALAASLETQELIRKQNILLEEKVNERTADLTIANQELSTAIKDLQDAQTQLVEAEKMASLGQLTAGVAHEINNPINFVSSNIKPLQRDIDDIIKIIETYDTLSPGEIKQQVDKLKLELDYDYLKEEVSMLLKGIQEGASRTVEIVQSLRNFSRLDEHDLKKADVREGLDSTLILLNSAMGGIVEVIKDYDPDVKEIDCFPGKLNQVFMNILSNSIYAIQKKYETKSGGTIHISVKQNQDYVEIKLKDNGVGMPKAVKNKVFEPFFTSKPVGEGTGLGLSIVYKIIENHKGQIKVESEEGEWTEFVITLPKFHEK